MPKGQKLIDWTPENDVRLMLTILALENIHPNCEAVASAFGKPHHNHTTNPPSTKKSIINTDHEYLHTYRRRRQRNGHLQPPQSPA